tara:strand:+ start:45 stop:314 length:270 start_codon:yes stop_codon:yes gene_type:complete
MPYHVKKVGTGFKVFKKGTNKALSKEPMSKSKAEAQMKAVEMSESKAKPKGTHKMPDGSVMSGKKHTKNSKPVNKSKPANKKTSKEYKK